MSQQWYVYKGGQQVGPYSWEQLCQKASSGGINAADMVWTNGMANWSRASDINGLFPKASAPPTSTSAPNSSHGYSPYQPGSQPGNFQAAPPPQKKGKGLLVAFIIVFVAVIGISGYFVHGLLTSNGDEGLTANGGAPAGEVPVASDTDQPGAVDPGGTVPGGTVPGATGNGIPQEGAAVEAVSEAVQGAWVGEEFGEVIFFRLGRDGTMTIAAPDEGLWGQTDYRIVPYNGVFSLEAFATDINDWEFFFDVEVLDQNRILLTDYYDDVILDRIDEGYFQDIISQLEQVELY